MRARYFVVCSLIVAGALAAGLVLYPHLPETVPSHWNFAGKVNGYSSRASAVLLFPAGMAMMLALFAVLPSISPRHFEIDRFEHAYLQIMLIITSMFAYLYLIFLGAAYSGTVPTARAVPGGICVAWALLGSVLGKVNRNFFVGVRTPWTLADERVWHATHRFAAKTFVTSGLLAAVPAFLLGQFRLTMVILVIGALAPVVYSLVYYKRLEKQGAIQ